MNIKYFLTLCFYCLYISSAYADQIIKRLPSGLEAFAEYKQGETNKPSVLLLHGFLQTHHFRTIDTLRNNLADEGYSVLSPTLSLGINRRKKSLACEAMHLHSMEDDINEIDFWVKWLISQENKPIIIVGHSYGSAQALAYAVSGNKHTNVKALVITSLVKIENSFKNYKEAKEAPMADGLVSNRLAYCDKYVSPRENFLSYTYWDHNNILKALREVTLPISVINGDKDERSSKQWISQLRENNVNVIVLEGANHFFDNREFELLDAEIELIDKL